MAFQHLRRRHTPLPLRLTQPPGENSSTGDTRLRMRGLGGVRAVGERLVGVRATGERLVGVRAAGERLVGVRATGERLVGVRGLTTRDLGVTKVRSLGLVVRDVGVRVLVGERERGVKGPLIFWLLTVFVVRVTALFRQPESCRMLLLEVVSLRHESPEPLSGRLLVGEIGEIGETGERDERRVTMPLPGELTLLPVFLSRKSCVTKWHVRCLLDLSNLNKALWNSGS